MKVNQWLGLGRRVEGQELADLEAKLQFALPAVAPRPRYVRDLRRRLMSYPSPVVEPDSRMAQYAMLGVASLVSGTLLVVMGVRFVGAILGALGALMQLRRGVPSGTAARSSSVLPGEG
jgi:hypothetical protein